MSLPELLVIRHGETEWNREHRWQGALDSPLTEKGEGQARDVGGILLGLGVSATSHRFLTSPQPRSRRTSDLALAIIGASATTHDALREIGVGDWTGLSAVEIEAGWPGPEDEHFLDRYARAPNGERFDALWKRVGEVLDSLDGPTVIFTHGITSRVLRTRALGLTLAELDEVPGGQGVIHRIRDGRHDTLAP
ncbi:histidine phosphatase family protein [Pelagovum pacificum]|uniref:Histidine phosphatase family protein n=1 Tax=Pelagovum pacificum TaxID=2588711 RepID=A0A5C5GBZ8_9RHOB|nr:histidine phosphatase family protein [Pelagovum pacificum]QQA44714.1 histidine phosphatase family protein [Pelagovum pacificum]TNY32178.1 histidine phosphatase family protein [Pelagovum pacificum]